MASMALLAAFGIVIPLRRAAQANPALLASYHGILLALIAVYGYMLIELGHYGIYPAAQIYKAQREVFLHRDNGRRDRHCRQVAVFSIAPFFPYLLRLAAFHFAQRAR